MVPVGPLPGVGPAADLGVRRDSEGPAWQATWQAAGGARVRAMTRPGHAGRAATAGWAPGRDARWHARVPGRAWGCPLGAGGPVSVGAGWRSCLGWRAEGADSMMSESLLHCDGTSSLRVARRAALRRRKPASERELERGPGARCDERAQGCARTSPSCPYFFSTVSGRARWAGRRCRPAEACSCRSAEALHCCKMRPTSAGAAAAR
jgi:hypothetical protein